MAKIRDKENLVKKTSEKYLRVSESFDELSRRLWAASESISIGYGGVEVVSSATGISKPTIEKGIREIHENNYPRDRTRREGGGRKEITHKDPGIIRKLRELIEPSVSGDPQSSLLWVSRSIRKLSEEMTGTGYRMSHTKVRSLLLDLGFRLKGNRKNVEGKSYPDRNEQFEHINNRAMEFMENNDPVISVDTKKKELIGNFRNNGKEWSSPENTEEVNVYDFLSGAEGKANPYGVYDIKNNEGWVSVGIDHDTAEFAVESIRRWWNLLGKKRYPEAKKLLITADGGGSNGSRVKLWKIELQKLSTETGLNIGCFHT